jgi:hypothetical protein
MTPRPTTLVLGSALLVVIGLSGLAAGAGFLMLVAPQTGEAANLARIPGVVQSGLLVGAIMAGYALAALVAGVGTWTGRRWAWVLGIVTILVGLGILAYCIVLLGGPDPILDFGVVVWAVTLACLLAPSTRRTLRT